jgi:parallel beta helix pectate lyase-like protein
MRTGALGSPLLAGLAALTLVGGCSGSSAPRKGSAGSGGADAAGTGGATAGASGNGTVDAGSAGSRAVSDAGTDAGAIQIAVWTDSTGACPSGATKIDLTTVSALQDATRGEGAYAADPPDACYLIHDGTYVQSDATLPMFVKKGGSSATARRLFIGQSRAGVVIHGRATIDAGVSHVQLANLTFDLTGYAQSGAFNTLTLLTGSDDRIDHVTFTGDCATGLQGGAVEVDGTTDVVLESCLIEKFGHCAGGGHLDHGVYLASGDGLTIRNNEIRLNSSRGIQLNTEQGTFGTLNDVTIELNRIHDNGHADYEDGIVLNGGGTGTISNVTIQHNLIYGNYYSGVRSVDVAYAKVLIQRNTFFHDGVAAAGAGKSEVNLDSLGSGANTDVTLNILASAGLVFNDCYDAFARNYVLTGNFVDGTVPTGAAGNCISGSTAGTAMFVDPTMGDFHSPIAAGAYAP